MTATNFKLAKSGKLAPPNLYPSADEAVIAGRDFWPGEGFTIHEVRQATLADFVIGANVVGDIRERMADLIGDDSALDARDANDAPVFDVDDFSAELRIFVDAYAEAKGITLEGINLVVRSRDVKAE